MIIAIKDSSFEENKGSPGASNESYLSFRGGGRVTHEMNAKQPPFDYIMFNATRAKQMELMFIRQKKQASHFDREVKRQIKF